MAVVIEANYSKKIGLPAFSSHSYSLTVRTELADLNQIEQENTKLYALLQSSVDREIQEAGLVPTIGSQLKDRQIARPRRQETLNGTGHHSSDDWNCSEKQRELILKLVKDQNLDKKEVEALSTERFNASVKELNRREASELIQELLEKFDVSEPNRNGNGSSKGQYRGSRR